MPLRRVTAFRRSLVVLVALGVAALVPMWADSSGLTETTAFDAADLVRVDLQSSRMVGFAPMQIDVSGVLLDSAGREIALPSEVQATLVLGGTFSAETVEREQLFTDDEPIHAADGSRVARSLVIRKPGAYTLRWVVKDGDRGTVLSDEVRIRVL